MVVAVAIPIVSMYGIYANIGGIFMVNVTIYSIHGSYGIWILCWVWVMGIPCWPAQASLVEVVEAQQRACCRSRLPPLLRALRHRTAQTKTPYFLLTVAFVPSLSGMSMYAQNSSIHFAFHAQNKLAWWSSNIPSRDSHVSFRRIAAAWEWWQTWQAWSLEDGKTMENHTTLWFIGDLMGINPLNGKVPSGYWTVCYGNHGPLIDDKPWWFTYKHGDFP